MSPPDDVANLIWNRRVSIALRHSHTEITDFCLVAAC
jgi:hypothetical protein